MCTAYIVMSENINVFSRNFYFGDKDGDRIFSSYTGNRLKNARENVIIAGTGKYKGISGKGLGIATQVTQEITLLSIVVRLLLIKLIKII